jgi:hypothetical protein
MEDAAAAAATSLVGICDARPLPARIGPQSFDNDDKTSSSSGLLAGKWRPARETRQG